MRCALAIAYITVTDQSAMLHYGICRAFYDTCADGWIATLAMCTTDAGDAHCMFTDSCHRKH